MGSQLHLKRDPNEAHLARLLRSQTKRNANFPLSHPTNQLVPLHLAVLEVESAAMECVTRDVDSNIAERHHRAEGRSVRERAAIRRGKLGSKSFDRSGRERSRRLGVVARDYWRVESSEGEERVDNEGGLERFDAVRVQIGPVRSETRVDAWIRASL